MVGTTIQSALVEGIIVCLLFSLPFVSAIVCSILVPLWAGSSVAQRSDGWAESKGSLLLAGHLKPPFLFPLLVKVYS